MRNLLLLFGLVLIVSSCQKDTGGGSSQELTVKTMLDVSYGTDALNKMDIYLPAGRKTSTTKVMILVHGGGWNQGDKADFTPFMDTLKRRLPDYAIININYRLATGTSNYFPSQENDVKAAIEFINSKRTEYSISDKFVLLGASAGAHLSLLQAYKISSPIKVKAVVDFFGPTELTLMYNNPINPLIPLLLSQVIGGTPTTHASMYAQSSPVNVASAQSPPTLILQGGADVVVDPAQSVLLRTKLQTLGVIHQYVFYPTENHGWTGANLTDSFDKIGAFLAANVQ